MSKSTYPKTQPNSAAIVDLMEDLGQALNVNPDSIFLGGGNPAGVPEFENKVALILSDIAKSSDRLHQLVGVYQSSQGAEHFIESLADFFTHHYGWPISNKNIAITNGSQSAFYILLNHFVSRNKHICMPMMPEYLGYADQIDTKKAIKGCQPRIEITGKNRFKYHIDFDRLEILESTAALCISRPTNPSGNVIDLQELKKLNQLALVNEIPLIVDCAYGNPFPGLNYATFDNFYHENIIFVFSLSKLGLPGARTGIVVAPEEVVQMIAAQNTVMSLANGNLGPAIMTELLNQHDFVSLINNDIKPYYQNKRDFALRVIEKSFININYKIHEPEGAFFLWVWLDSLSISSTELYARLKQRGVLIMDGKHFFYGLAEWSHSAQCIRINYCQSESVIRAGVEIIAEEVIKTL